LPSPPATTASSGERGEHGERADGSKKPARFEDLKGGWKHFAEEHPLAAQRIRAEADENGDGKLDEGERKVAFARMQEFRKASHEQRKSMEEQFREQRKQLAEHQREERKELAEQQREALGKARPKADRDGDGKVERGERQGERQGRQRGDDRREDRRD
jgi:hypothetical protein